VSSLSEYKATLRERSEAERREQALRKSEARTAAVRAAGLLREQFGVRRVVLFRSAAGTEPMTDRSDIDLAVWDLPADEFYRAISLLQDWAAPFRADLVAAERLAPAFLEAILGEGVDL
jgi:uncharacterized protein